MKKLFLSLSFITGCLFAQAQNIGIGTTSPHSSAALDITSTSKGLLIPRMTTAQRTAIPTPAAGLMVYDITTGGFWFYNGSAWNTVGSGGSFTLPYSGSASTSVSAFAVLNTGTGAALEGSGSGGSGVYGNSFSGAGVNALSINGYGVIANSTNNSAIYGFSNNANATIYGTNSNGLGVGVQGNASLHHGVLGTSAGTAKAGVRGEATGTGGYGVYGTTSSSTGYGVYGANLTGVAIYGSSNTGTGVRAVSNSGLALEVNGNLKISGGNTTPVDGGILTSDASGNASWQKTKVAFMASGINSSYRNFGEDFTFKIHWEQEVYDYDNNYFLHVGTNPVSNSSTFTVPVSGLYHFDTQISAGATDNSTTVQYGLLTIRATRNGSLVKALTIDMENDYNFPVFVTGRLSGDLKLQAGDLVFVDVSIHTGGVSGVLSIPGSAFFSGHLVFAD